MMFPVTRSGDTGYDVVLSYHTLNGSGTSPLDYLGAADKIVIPAGSASAEIPVTIPAYPYNDPDRTFQLQLDDATGVGPALSFADPQAFSAGNQPYFSTIADINGDSKPDLIVNAGVDRTVSVLLNTTPPGASSASFTAAVPFAVGAGPFSVTTADINGDGKPDLVVSNYFDQTISVLLNTTQPGDMTPSFSAQQTVSVGFQMLSVTAADINGDGKPDLIVADYFGNSGISVLVNTTERGAMTSSFTAQQSFAVVSHPYSVTAADLNGDGKVDLITANLYDGTISILLNNAMPGAAVASFAPQQTFITSGSLIAAVADINGDGKPDLIIGGSPLTVLMNSTVAGAMSLGFADPQYITAMPAAGFTVAADVNGDGKPDLLVITEGNTVSMLRNITVPGAATAAFSAPKTIGTAANSRSISVADLNGDGKPDLLVTGLDSDSTDHKDTVFVLINTTPPDTSTPSFATQQSFAAGSAPASVTTADINGDGKQDLIVADYVDNTVSVLLNIAAPGASKPVFAAKQAFATGAVPNSVIAADVNGDGRSDLIVANENDSTVSVLLNITAPGATLPSFAIQQTLATGWAPFSVTAADVNGDGKPDLITANRGGNSVSVLLNTTPPGTNTSSFVDQQSFPTGLSPHSVGIADINGDGKPDVIVANADYTVSVLLNTTPPGASTATFTAQQSFNTDMSIAPFSIAIADITVMGNQT